MTLIDIPDIFEEDGVAAGLLARYFGTLPADGSPFTGAFFERLGGGGDRLATRDLFTAEDLVAVSMLSVDVPAPAALEILQTRALELSDLLRLIPTDTDLVDVPDDTINDGWPATKLWNVLNALPGVGWVTAGKLLARKRPRLVPVYDTVVKSTLQLTGGFWEPLRCTLRADGQHLHERLLKIRAESGIGDDISPLRVFDIVVWMHGKGYVPPGTE
ncbi:DUF6308 family protein [Actinacidiphila soli]|uniref:DUF6308 family protein n=1 Tax=Actinacidiphila soli TaxID=2487275 RepID=UPI000FCC0B6C|nr:DUF6308 family protein [Actinacidiphila soli]